MRRSAPLILFGCLVFAACTRPIDRPLSGAQPPSGSYTPRPIDRVEAPPTLSPPTVLALTASSQQTPTATSSPGGPPILLGLQPPADGIVPVGEIRVSAQIIGSSNLTEVTATLDGQPVPAEAAGRDERHWTAFFSRKFDPGEYEVRIVAKDDQGRAGGFRWRFTVASPTPAANPTSGATPAPENPTPQPQPTATPKPSQGPSSDQTQASLH